MMQVEQAFEKRIRHLRVAHHIQHVASGPAHRTVWTAHLSMTMADGREVVANGVPFPKRKEATRHALMRGLALLRDEDDPCDTTVSAVGVWRSSKQPTVCFDSPPVHWFADAQILGVDFEGSPPVLVQIACREGVYVDRVSSPAAQAILRDERHTHCVFGEHETELVARPWNLQTDKKQSLVELVSITLCPSVRITKDKTIHERVDWASATARETLSAEATAYAAADAYLTRKLGVRLWNKKP